MSSGSKTGVLFVCLGNICRSPLAEGVFIHQARARGVDSTFRVESCGTGHWHVGDRPDPRSQAVADRNGVELPSRARLFDPSSDPDAFEHILAMDASNVRNLERMGLPRGRAALLRSFDPTLAAGEDLTVPDPYTGGPEGFDLVFAMVESACAGLLESILADRA